MCGRPDDLDEYWAQESEELAKETGDNVEVAEDLNKATGHAYIMYCTYNKERDAYVYSIACLPLNGDGSIAKGEEGGIGGQPGMHDCEDMTRSDAEQAWKVLLSIKTEDEFWAWIDMSNKAFPGPPGKEKG